MITIDFHVADWAAWIPDHGDLRAPITLPAASAAEVPPPLLLRRRITRTGQQALRLAWSLPASANARMVFASCDGEFSRTLSVLDTLTHSGTVSPADFSLSVHHALAGLLSIARGNQAGHTAVAAGRDSLWHGLLEAASCLTEPDAAPILFVYHNEPLPAPYDRFTRPGEETIALTLALTRAPTRVGLRLSASPTAGGRADPCPGQALLATLGNGTPATIVGDRHVWNLVRTDAPA